MELGMHGGYFRVWVLGISIISGKGALVFRVWFIRKCGRRALELRGSGWAGVNDNRMKGMSREHWTQRL